MKSLDKDIAEITNVLNSKIEKDINEYEKFHVGEFI